MVSFDALLSVGNDDVVVTNDQGEVVDESTVSSAFALSGRVPVGGRWTAVAEIPLGHYRLSVSEGSAESQQGGFVSSDLSLGNPYLGVELRLRPD